MVLNIARHLTLVLLRELCLIIRYLGNRKVRSSITGLSSMTSCTSHIMKRCTFIVALFLLRTNNVFSTCLRSTEHMMLSSVDANVQVGVRYIQMTDKLRLGPFSNSTEYRKLTVSLFYPMAREPALSKPREPLASAPKLNTLLYMPSRTAALYGQLITQFGFPQSTFEPLKTLCHLDTAAEPIPSYLLVVLLPGGGAPLLFHSTELEDLARRGLMVAAIDHPHDTLIVEFSDGEAVLGLNRAFTRVEIELLVKVRAQDVSFVIDELGKQSSQRRGPINVTNFIAVGHSLGGATVAEVTLNETRIKAGMNIDGILFGSKERPITTISKPFLSARLGGHRWENYWQWDSEWRRLVGWKLELVISGAAHSTFTDFPLIAEGSALREMLGRQGEKLLGTVVGIRGLRSWLSTLVPSPGIG